MIQSIAFLVLCLVSVMILWGVLIAGARLIICSIRKKPLQRPLTVLKKTAFLLAVVMAVTAGLVVFSQYKASTPPLHDEKGNIPANSIAELRPVELNGRKQWISIRGLDKNKPILLFLAGGPGGSQLAAVRQELPQLERHFVVVGWDQPGSAKSYYAGAAQGMTPEIYIQDGYALTQYLRERFGQEKIYLVGESWGSALGIFLIDRYPQLYHGLIGTGQMIDFAETERMDYEKAWEIAGENKDTAVLKKLEANGLPPYYGKGVTWRGAVYLNYLSSQMAGNPAIHNPGYNTLQDIFSPEYGLLDKINYVRGIINTFNQVYQQLYEIDLREDYAKLQVPVYFFEGRHDINAPPVLVEGYLEVLDAPRKEILWFEHSGHSPWLNEPDKFTQELIARFQTAQAGQSGEGEP